MSRAWGKTATAAAFAATAEDVRAVVLWGTSYEGAAQPPYGPWFDALAPLAADPGQAAAVPDLSPPEARFRLFDAVHRSVLDAARDGPVVLVIDDLQWASSDRLSLFGHLAARTDRSPIVLVGTYRDPDAALEGVTPLGRLLAALVRPATARAGSSPRVGAGRGGSLPLSLARGRRARHHRPRRP